jgi:hypothetical protein
MNGTRRALRYLGHDVGRDVMVDIVHDQSTGACEHDEDDVELVVDVVGDHAARAKANKVDVEISRVCQRPVHTVALGVEESGQIDDIDVDLGSSLMYKVC